MCELHQNNKSLRIISDIMKGKGVKISHTTVSKILEEMGPDSDDNGSTKKNVV